MSGPDLQAPFDVAVVIPTVVRPTLMQAVRSVFSQHYAGRVQILLGIDRWEGRPEDVQALLAESPSHMAVTVIDLGYSTSQLHGGLYPSAYGGGLKSMLTLAANSRFVAYLDDDNWWAPNHLATLLPAIAGKQWAFCLRHFVEAASGESLVPDTWESVGPNRGVYGAGQGGFVDTNCFLLDKIACHDVIGEWAMTRYAGGTGGDRQVLKRLRDRPYGESGQHTVFYRQRLEGLHPFLLWRLHEAGVDLSRYLPPDRVPGEEVWAQCRAADAGRGADRAA